MSTQVNLLSMPVILSVCHLPEHFGRKKMHVLGKHTFLPEGGGFLCALGKVPTVPPPPQLIWVTLLKAFTINPAFIMTPRISLAHTAAYVCFYVGVALMMCGAEANSLCSPPRNQPIKASGGGPTATLHQFL
jgi:hypothetical protein